MRWWPVVLCACNQVLGIHETHPPPPDAPPVCPAIGTPPQFSAVLTQVGTKGCWEYTESRSAGLAMAMCIDTDGMQHVETGAIGDDLSIASELVEPGWNYNNPRLSASGDDALVGAVSVDGSTFAIRRYTRAGMTWTRAPDPPLGATLGDQLGAISQMRRITILRSLDLVELDADTGAQLASTPIAQLGLASVGDYAGRAIPALTADGLRLVILGELAGSGTPVALYTDRPSLQAAFDTVQPLDGVPHAYDLDLAEDCARIYYSSLFIGGLFYEREVEP